MIKELLASAVIAASVLAASTGAEAGGRHNAGYHGHGAIHAEHRGKPFRKKRHWNKHYHGGWVHIGRPYQGCGYYRWKARHTGSEYWWKKYRFCIHR